jgi:hypothetical protein
MNVLQLQLTSNRKSAEKTIADSRTAGKCAKYVKKD